MAALIFVQPVVGLAAGHFALAEPVGALALAGAGVILVGVMLEAVRGGDAGENARLAREVLGGRKGPRRDVVLLNAAAALLVAERVANLREGVARAGEAIDRGQAAALLQRVGEALRA